MMVRVGMTTLAIASGSVARGRAWFEGGVGASSASRSTRRRLKLGNHLVLFSDIRLKYLHVRIGASMLVLRREQLFLEL